MAKDIICKNCGETYTISFGGWGNNDLCKKCWDKDKRMENEVVINKPVKTGYTSSYDTTRAISLIISFIGWFMIVISIVVCVFTSFVLLLPAIGVIVSGLLLVMGGQLTRAMIDTADHTGEMIVLMKNNRSKRTILLTDKIKE